MHIQISASADQSGQRAAEAAAHWINGCIASAGDARIVLSTGASQFEFFEHFIRQPIAWSKVTMFHLDEYIGLPVSHKASFRRYLYDRFVNRVPLRQAHLIDGEGDIAAEIGRLSVLIAERPVDLGLIGIGENAHIAFNDPPADFDTDAAYKIVALDDDCKMQQVREGWFASIEEVPNEAISMTVRQIMRCRRIISVVPRSSKAEAVSRTLESDVSPLVPATMLKRHSEWSMYLDKDSASRLPIKV